MRLRAAPALTKFMTTKQPTSSPRPIPPAAIKTLHEAAAAHQAGNFVQAEALYRRVLKLDAEQSQVLLMLGILQAQRGDYSGAEKLLRKALKLNPDDAASQFNYGNVLLGLSVSKMRLLLLAGRFC